MTDNTSNFNIQGLGVNVPKDKASSDPKVAAKEIETVFLSEFLKFALEQTSFGKDKFVSTYLPVITTEVAKSFSERGIGIGAFVLKSSNQLSVTSSDKAGNGSQAMSNEPPPPQPPLVKGGDSLHVTHHSSLPLNPPVSGRVSSGYGLRHDPIDGRLHAHNGIDIAVPEGTPVMPAAGGKVVYSGYAAGYGNCIVIEHDNGLTSLYAHNSINYVKAGEVVDENKVIALSGSTGRSTGPHLHFEVREKGLPVDPMGMFG